MALIAFRCSLYSANGQVSLWFMALTRTENVQKESSNSVVLLDRYKDDDEEKEEDR